jgi:hypothetical protein
VVRSLLTCASYLNSILQVSYPVAKCGTVTLLLNAEPCSLRQYLYSIKPLREAVLSFEQDTSVPPTPRKPEVERSRRCQ